jgi:hypothetical protein
MKRTRGAAAIAVLLGLLGVVAPSAVSATAPSPVLLRDNQASADSLANPAGACPGVNPPVGCFQGDTESEPSVAVDPTNRDHAVAVFHVGRAGDGGAATDGYAVTFDQGRSWRQGLFPGLTQATGGRLQRVSDPRVAFAPDGRHVYATAQPYNNDVAPAASSVVSMTSSDGGLTWAQPVVVVEDNISQNFSQSDAYLLNNGFDQPDLTVDMGSTSGHHLGRIYLVWVRLSLAQAAYAAYSDDAGLTWVKGPGGQGFVINPGNVPLYPRPVVLANGDLAVMDWNANPYIAAPPSYFGDPGPVQSNPETSSASNQTGGYQLYRAAGAGGVSGATPLAFGPVPSTVAYLANNTLRGQRSAEKQPLFAVDARTGRMYAAWTDARFRTDMANDILLTYSDDGGATWRSPQRVNPGAAGDNVDHWCAMVSAGADGVLRVGYRQRAESGTVDATFSRFSPTVDTYYVQSADGGKSFTRPLKVSTNASDMRFGAFDGGQTNVGQGGIFLGDYDAMAEKDGVTYVVRSEPVRVSQSEPVVYPPTVHHQRTWIAVVGEVAAAGSGSTSPEVPATLTGTPGTSTAGPAPGPLRSGLVALGALLVVAFASARRRRTAE